MHVQVLLLILPIQPFSDSDRLMYHIYFIGPFHSDPNGACFHAWNTMETGPRIDVIGDGFMVHGNWTEQLLYSDRIHGNCI